MENKGLTPTQKLVMFCNAVIDQDWETADAIEKDLGLDKVPYPYENMD